MSKSIFKTTAQLSASIGSKLAHRSCPGPHPSEWGIRVFRPRQNPVRQFVGLVRETGFEAPVNPDNPCDRTAAPMQHQFGGGQSANQISEFDLRQCMYRRLRTTNPISEGGSQRKSQGFQDAFSNAPGPTGAPLRDRPARPACADLPSARLASLLTRSSRLVPDVDPPASVGSLAPALRYFLRPLSPRFGNAPLPSPTSQPKRRQPINKESWPSVIGCDIH